jgi:hypothetical protein
MEDNMNLIPWWVQRMVFGMFLAAVTIPAAAGLIVIIELIIEHFVGPL